jgi:hypothetical protein
VTLAKNYPPDTPISIQDIKPSVFRSLLHFVYTDDVPRSEELKNEARELLHVADRFGLLCCEPNVGDFLSRMGQQARVGRGKLVAVNHVGAGEVLSEEEITIRFVIHDFKDLNHERGIFSKSGSKHGNAT